MKRATLKLLLVFFTMFTLVSTAIAIYTHQLPLEEEMLIPVCEYQQTGEYYYIATLTPGNVIYEGKTTLRPNEGTLYLSITEKLTASFAYRFEITLPANITISYKTSETIVASKWTKKISETSLTTLYFTEATLAEFQNANFSSIIVQNIESVASKISQETGAYASDYNLTIATEVYVEAVTQEGIITETFTPKLSLLFTRGTTQGNIISTGTLDHVKNGELPPLISIISHEEVMNQRYISYVLLPLGICGLASTWMLGRTEIPPKEERQKFIEEIIEPYEEIIVKTSQMPNYAEPMIAINMKTLEDLVMVADVLAKPILHATQNQTHVFNVIDGVTKYEYVITAPNMPETKTVEEEED